MPEYFASEGPEGTESFFPAVASSKNPQNHSNRLLAWSNPPDSPVVGYDGGANFCQISFTLLTSNFVFSLPVI